MLFFFLCQAGFDSSELLLQLSNGVLLIHIHRLQHMQLSTQFSVLKLPVLQVNLCQTHTLDSNRLFDFLFAHLLSNNLGQWHIKLAVYQSQSRSRTSPQLSTRSLKWGVFPHGEEVCKLNLIICSSKRAATLLHPHPSLSRPQAAAVKWGPAVFPWLQPSVNAQFLCPPQESVESKWVMESENYTVQARVISKRMRVCITLLKSTTKNCPFVGFR